MRKFQEVLLIIGLFLMSIAFQMINSELEKTKEKLVKVEMLSEDINFEIKLLKEKLK